MLPGCRLSQACSFVNQERGRGIPAPRDGGRQGAQGGPVRARECTPGRSCGPLDHLWSGAARFECWWPLARGNPASYGSSRDPAFGRARRRKQNQYRVFREPRSTRAVMEGGNSYPSCIEQASHTATRAGVRLNNVHAGSSSGRWQPFRDERSEGSRTQRWGTAADEE